MNAKKRCFVLMGFGKKTDYKTNRTLDLDKTYRIIRKAVEKAGLECIRADDIVHSGMIDKPMYENLLSADVAIADLSTSNENAIYELGVRHALKPHATIVLAETEFKFPFDLSHLVIRSYKHLGTGIDYEEAERLERELVTALDTIVPKCNIDSPVYTCLPFSAAVSQRGCTGFPRRECRNRGRRRRAESAGWGRGGLCSADRAVGGHREVLNAARVIPRCQEGWRFRSGAQIPREAARDGPKRSLSDSAARTGDLQEQAAQRAGVPEGGATHSPGARS